MSDSLFLCERSGDSTCVEKRKDLKGEASLDVSVGVTLEHRLLPIGFLGSDAGPDCHKLDNHIMHFREAIGEWHEMETHPEGFSIS